MSNDLMALRCPCGARFYLAKRLGDAWYAPPGFATDKMDAWFAEHATCGEWDYPAYPTLEYDRPRIREVPA